MKKYVLEIGEKEYTAEVKTMTADEVEIIVNGTEYKVMLKEFGRKKGSIPQIRTVEHTAATPAPKPAAPKAKPAAGSGSGNVPAPLPGLILTVKVKEGDTVKVGQDLLIMEAMKMENQVQAPFDGTVKKIYVKNGDSVAEEDPLVDLERPFITSL
ncbi:MAG: biotin/lipoyl-binding protein [bacterium]|nr:biotin/lipoyl-binding protein [bacterium]